MESEFPLLAYTIDEKLVGPKALGGLCGRISNQNAHQGSSRTVPVLVDYPHSELFFMLYPCLSTVREGGMGGEKSGLYCLFIY